MASECIANVLAVGAAVEILVGQRHCPPDRLHETRLHHHALYALKQDLAGQPRRRQQRGLISRRRSVEQVGDEIPEAAREDHAEAMDFVDERARPAIARQGTGYLELEIIE